MDVEMLTLIEYILWADVHMEDVEIKMTYTMMEIDATEPRMLKCDFMKD
jgi:hypothetical protein